MNLQRFLTGHHIHLYHYPIFDWNYKYHKQWHLYGHQHEIRSEGVEMMNLPYSHNVNVELNNYRPISMKEIIKLYEKICTPLVEHLDYRGAGWSGGFFPGVGFAQTRTRTRNI